jgi:nitroreductase
MHVDDAITSRKSIRRFLPTPAPRETVEHILEVAARAPSGHKVQPWRVYALAGAPLASPCRDIVAAASTDAQRHRPEYEYDPTQWHEPYLGRRRTTGIALGHADPAAPKNAFTTAREPARAFTPFAGFDGAAHGR